MAPDVTDIASSEKSGDALGITILDVGHGNSAVIRDGKICAVIDAAPGDVVPDELDRTECDHIEHLIISHSDRDHSGGGPGLILDDVRTVGTVWFNPDGLKQTDIWERLLRAVHTRQRRGGLNGHQMIHTETGQTLRCGRARLEVSHPSILMAGSGPTTHTSTFGRLDANTLSVVIRVHLEDQPVALLAADMDGKALEHIRENEREVSAPVLVFPHHGGLPGTADPQEFASTLATLVQPELVIFSIKSVQRPANPNPRILSGVRAAVPDAHIACTQLSVHCHEQDTPASSLHLASRPAAGRKDGRCCAGTITITKTSTGLVYEPPLADHKHFVASFVNTPLCGTGASLTSQRPAAEILPIGNS
jgi:beta-lactamase superfamily II metal-dependent hydrolase